MVALQTRNTLVGPSSSSLPTARLVITVLFASNILFLTCVCVQKQGITYMSFLWGITLGNWFTSLVKGKGLVVEATRKAYGFSK